MPPAWRNQNMSMRNPMSMSPMNNNPMGVQAPSQLQGVGNMQQAARNVMMQQPPGANTAMRPLNMPGMQFDASRNAMTPTPRAPLTPNPNPQQWGNLSGGSLYRTDDQKWSRMARQAGVRPQDMAQWRSLKMREMGGMAAQGPPGGMPVAMGPQQNQAAQPKPNPVAAIQADQPQPGAGIVSTIANVAQAAKPFAAAAVPYLASRLLPGATSSTGSLASAMNSEAGAARFGNMAKYAGGRNATGASFRSALRGGLFPFALGGFNPYMENPSQTIQQQAMQQRPAFVANGTPPGYAAAMTAEAQRSQAPRSLFGSVSNPGFGSPISQPPPIQQRRAWRGWGA